MFSKLTHFGYILQYKNTWINPSFHGFIFIVKAVSKPITLRVYQVVVSVAVGYMVYTTQPFCEHYVTITIWCRRGTPVQMIYDTRSPRACRLTLRPLGQSS